MSVSIPGYRDVTPAGPHRCPPLPDRVSDYATPVGTRLQCEECGKAYHESVERSWIENVSDQLPFGDFAPGRWAWILADAAPTTERCPACWGAIPRAVPGHCVDIDGAWWHAPGDCVLCDCCDALCEVCRGAGRCAPIPARGRQRAWEWTP